MQRGRIKWGGVKWGEACWGWPDRVSGVEWAGVQRCRVKWCRMKLREARWGGPGEPGLGGLGRVAEGQGKVEVEVKWWGKARWGGTG